MPQTPVTDSLTRTCCGVIVGTGTVAMLKAKSGPGWICELRSICGLNWTYVLEDGGLLGFGDVYIGHCESEMVFEMDYMNRGRYSPLYGIL